MPSRSPIFLIVVAALVGLSIWGYIARPYSYGLDVKGGVRLVYQIDPASMTPEQKLAPEKTQSDLIKIMNARAGAALGVVEAAVSKKGTDQIVIELPGYTNIEEAKATMSTTAKVIVYRARNVTSPTERRIYDQIGETKNDEAGPYIAFTRTSGAGGEIKPGDEAYKQIIDNWDKILEGSDVSDARPLQQTASKVVPEFTFSSDGARKMEEFSRKFSSKQENIAFVLDGRVLSLAHLRPDQILSDNAYIDGQFEPSYVRKLTDLVKAGALPVDLKELSSQKVDPTIGAKALDQMVLAGAISIAITLLFLIIYYGFPGVVASTALALYILISLTVLKLIGATFSLAAIAGFILSVSMAVDANILIFERLKEEMRTGRSLTTAIELSFKRALSAIFDSNAATVLTSSVLWTLGEGPVKGFATTLIIGVLISFFTAVAVTRALIVGLTSIGIGTNVKWYAMDRNWFGEDLEKKANEKPLEILQKSKTYFIISIALMAVGLVFVGLGGIKPNVEFQGGFEGIYRVTDASTTASKISSSLKTAGIEKANVKFGTARDPETKQDLKIAYITIPYEAGVAKGDNGAMAKIATAAGLSSEGASFTEIGPTVQAETIQKAILGIVLSSLLIILLLTIRFGIALGGMKNGLKFGISAIIAMLHDVVVVIGTAGIVGFMLGWEVSGLFISAMLTVASFSVHDTIVIFDRIRENLRKPHAGEDFQRLVNRSITQSVARSLNTSITAIITLILMIVIGTPTPELKFMCVAMLTGLVIGTYSSIFNASPILYLWDNAVIKRKGEEHGLMQEAERERLLALQFQGAAPEGAPGTMQPNAQGSYGTVKRRRGVDKGVKNLDEE